MKRTFLTLVCYLVALISWAQAPNYFDFQSLVRDEKGNFVTNKTIGVRISLLQGTIDGEAVYIETHTKSTNANGLLTLTIGGGTTSGNMSTIDWGQGPYFIKTEMDLKGGTNYTLSNTTQMMSVPYALYANYALNAQDSRVEELQKQLDSIKIEARKRDTLTSSEFEEIKQSLVTDMTFTVPKTTIKLTETMQIIADPLPWHTTHVTWTSSDESVATVRDGLVTPIRCGVTTITASSGTEMRDVQIAVVLPGEFSVSATKKVRFSTGLETGCGILPEQYLHPASTLRKLFKDNHYNYLVVGEEWPTCTSTDYEYVSDLGSWGEISLSDFDYLVNKRTNCAKLFGFATIDGTQGLMLLPDDWVLPSSLKFTPGKAPCNTNEYSITQWKILELNGAVFLPLGNYSCGMHSTGYAMPKVEYWSVTDGNALEGSGTKESITGYVRLVQSCQ